jgi:hypothetical protein
VTGKWRFPSRTLQALKVDAPSVDIINQPAFRCLMPAGLADQVL